MRYYNFIFFSVLVLILFSSCKAEDVLTEDPNPSNLVLDIVISDDRSGSINIIASADNTSEYAFYNGENTDDPIINSTGIFNYTYSLTGVYTIEIRAISSKGKFVKKESQINVTVGPDEGPIDGENGYMTPLSYEGMTMIWQDEFNGVNLNESNWNYEVNGNGGGNNELQFYRKENTSVADGYLVIEARKENFSGKSYTSSRLTTQNKQEFQYGRIDIRAILPRGKGIWPALWMLGSNFSTVGWPKCGEIDIMEMVGGTGGDNTVYGTLHWDNNGNNACTCDQNNDFSLAAGIFAQEFHVFSIIWNSNSIEWLVDDQSFKTVDISSADLDEFRNSFFFIFNVAVGGNWPGSPDGTTQFPQRMVVDYVRVFQ